MTREGKRNLWETRIKDYQSSGLTAVWCQKNGVNINTLKTMITRLGMAQRKSKRNKLTKQNVQWVGIKNHDEREEIVKDPSFVVVLGQAKIKISPRFDKETFREVVKILKDQC